MASGNQGGAGRRGRVGVRQAKLQKLKQAVKGLVESKDKVYREGFAQVKWGKFGREHPWLPCIIVPPDVIEENLSQLQLAKATLSSKRGAYVVYWLGYGILSKLNVSNIKDFCFDKAGGPNPNDKDNLLPRNIAFIESAVSEAFKMRNQSRDTLAALVKASREIGNSSVVDSDDDQQSTKTPRKRGRFQSDLEEFAADAVDVAHDVAATTRGGDFLEPAWPTTENSLGQLAPANLVISTNLDQSAVDARGAEGHGDQSGANGNEEEEEEEEDDDYDDGDNDDDDDDDFYVGKRKAKRKQGDGGGQKRQRKDTGKEKSKGTGGKTGPKAQKADQKPRKTLKEKLFICKRKLERLREKPQDDTACASAVDLLQKLGKVQISKSLLEETEIGKTIGALRKHPNEKVVTYAKSLRKIWKTQLLGESA